MGKKVFVVSNELCSGCRNCQTWCSFQNSQMTGFGPASGRIRVLKDPYGKRNNPKVDCDGRGCSRNEEGLPICVEMCPTGCLIYTDMDDLVKKRAEWEEKRRLQPVFKLIVPWKYPYPWQPIRREEF